MSAERHLTVLASKFASIPLFLQPPTGSAELLELLAWNADTDRGISSCIRQLGSRIVTFHSALLLLLPLPSFLPLFLNFPLELVSDEDQV